MKSELSKTEQQERFMELRVLGKTYDSISRELGVSKNTLLAWSKLFQQEIGNLSEMRKESLREQFVLTEEQRLEVLSEQIQKIREELLGREYSDIKTADLLSILFMLEEKAHKESRKPIFRETTRELELSNFEYINEWVG